MSRSFVAWWNISSRSGGPKFIRCIAPILAVGNFMTATPFSTSLGLVPGFLTKTRALLFNFFKMSFQGLQERLSALQETTAQLKELIDRLANLKFQPGSVPLDASEEGSVSGELSTEIGNLLRDGDDEKELLLEEVEYLRHEDKARLRDGVERQGQELDRSVTWSSLRFFLEVTNRHIDVDRTLAKHGWQQGKASPKPNASYGNS